MWDDFAAGWDENPAVQAYADAAYASLMSLEQSGKLNLNGARILDFGCGTGLLTEKLSHRAETVVALDTSEAMIEVLKQKAAALSLSNIKPIAMSIDAARTSYADLFEEPFDVVTCSSVCAFLEDYPATVQLLSQLLRSGGAFIQWDWEYDPSSDEPFGLTRSGIAKTLHDAGLRDIMVDVAFDIEFEAERMRPLIGFGVR